MNTNDEPNLTAYALGELPTEKTTEMEEEIARSPEARAFVDETRHLARLLRSEFRAELTESKRLNIMPLPSADSFWSDARWLSLGIAALLAVLAVVAVVILGKGGGTRELAQRGRAMPPADIQMEVETEQPSGDASDRAVGETSFQSAQTHRISTFPLKVGTESYTAVQRFIANGSLPPRDAVRIDEMINYFTYDEALPGADAALSITTEAADCPWQHEHRIVRIGIRARHDANPAAIVAQDARVQVEFNPATVGQFRLIGFEPGASANSEDVTAGHRVVALYEIVPANDAAAAVSSDMLAVRLDYREPRTGATRMVEKHVANSAVAFAAASPDLKFTAAVAEFGMILQKSPYRGRASFEEVLQYADADRDAPERAAFIELVQKAARLTSG